MMHALKGSLCMLAPLSYARFFPLKRAAPMWQRTAIIMWKMSNSKGEPTKETENKQVNAGKEKIEDRGSSEKTQKPKSSFFQKTNKFFTYIVTLLGASSIITIFFQWFTTNSINKTTEETSRKAQTPDSLQRQEEKKQMIKKKALRPFEIQKKQKVKDQEEEEEEGLRQFLKNNNIYTSTKEQLEKIFKNTRWTNVTGMPGNGKTTEVKNIVEELRKDKNIVFYINLRDKKNKGLIEQEKVDEILLLIDIFEQQTVPIVDSVKKRVFLFIDDINRLQGCLEGPEILKRKVLFILEKLATPVEGNRRLFTISSSSSFVQYLKNQDYISKRCKFEYLTDKTDEELKTGVKNMMQFRLNMRKLNKSPGDYQNFIEYLAKRRYTLRESMIHISDADLTLSDKELLQNFKQKQVKEINELAQNLYEQMSVDGLKDQFQQNIIDQMKEVAKLPWYNGKDGCKSDPLWELRMEFKGSSEGKTNITELLSDKNMIFYCHPRTQKSKDIINSVVKRMEDKLKKDKKKWWRLNWH